MSTSGFVSLSVLRESVSMCAIEESWTVGIGDEGEERATNSGVVLDGFRDEGV